MLLTARDVTADLTMALVQTTISHNGVNSARHKLMPVAGKAMAGLNVFKKSSQRSRQRSECFTSNSGTRPFASDRKVDTDCRGICCTAWLGQATKQWLFW